MHEFWLCFVPLFVAVDPLGALPVFIGLTGAIDAHGRRRIIVQSVVTATLVALAFLLVGKSALTMLGITVADFMIAGGTLLFVVSLSDILNSERPQNQADTDCMGAVPLGVPLIAGPAVLTTSLLMLNVHGLWPTAAAVMANVFIVGLVFTFANPINRIMGKAGSKTLSKIAHLLLAAIAVMIVRRGLTEFLSKP